MEFDCFGWARSLRERGCATGRGDRIGKHLIEAAILWCCTGGASERGGMRLPRSDVPRRQAIRYDPRPRATMRPVNNSVM